jgi:hypothetical protein
VSIHRVTTPVFNPLHAVRYDQPGYRQGRVDPSRMRMEDGPMSALAAGMETLLEILVLGM